MKQLKHSLLRGMDERIYQKSIAKASEKLNTLVCLPTGLGKTNISIIVAAMRLEKYPESKILILAPTKPLVSQHYDSFLKFMNLHKNDLQVITGAVTPTKRKQLYSKRIIFATPQTIQKDLESERFSLNDFSLLVIDELHHAVGRYAYPYIAKRFMEDAENPRILGLTASPGNTKKKIKEICKNTMIENIELRSEEDEDVKPYVKEKKIDWVEVELPESFQKIKSLLDETYRSKINRLGRVRTKKELLYLQQKFQASIRSGNKSAYGLSTIVAQAIKAEHAISLIETQGINILLTYLKNLNQDKTRAAKALLNDNNFSRALFLADGLSKQGSRHPKMSKLCSLIVSELSNNPESRIIIFANYRETVKEISKVISKIKGAEPITLIGQRDLSQKEQLEIIRKYGNEANILVTTSIGEEGLSLESADLAIFYEPVPSEIRQIQRRGRVGRTKFGRIVVLVTLDTRDEAYRWAAYHKEKKMKKTLHEMKSGRTRFT